jgi:hypothetical protein
MAKHRNLEEKIKYLTKQRDEAYAKIEQSNPMSSFKYAKVP